MTFGVSKRSRSNNAGKLYKEKIIEEVLNSTEERKSDYHKIVSLERGEEPLFNTQENNTRKKRRVSMRRLSKKDRGNNAQSEIQIKREVHLNLQQCKAPDYTIPLKGNEE